MHRYPRRAVPRRFARHASRRGRRQPGPLVAGFTCNSTAARWRRNMVALVPVNRMALDAFDELSAGGVQEPTRQASSFIAAYQRVEQRRAAGGDGHIQPTPAGDELRLTGDEARAIEPVLSDEIRAILLRTSASSTPARMSPPSPRPWRRAGADPHRARGHGRRRPRRERHPARHPGLGAVLPTRRPRHRGLARGARRQFGVRQVVQAGRGYSFSVKVDDLPAGPVYLPPPGSPARPSATGCGSRG